MKWPSISSFGEVKLIQILQYLNEMIISYTEDQWDKAYNDTSLILYDNQRKANNSKVYI